MNEFGYRFIANLRRAKWSKERILDLFKKLPVEQDFGKVQTYINQQFSTDITKIARLSGLLKAVEEYCEPKNLIEETKDFFREFFKEDIQFDIPQFKEYHDDRMILIENKLFVLYDAFKWISLATGSNIDDDCENALSFLKDKNDFYLVVEQDKMGYHFSWSDRMIAPPTPPNVFNSFLDIPDKSKNQYIGQSAIYFGISRCKKAISLFLNDIREHLNELKEGSSYSKLQGLLNYNAEVYDYIKFINESKGITGDTLDKIHFINNQYVVNDVHIGKMKLIEERNMVDYVYEQNEKKIRTEIYGELEKDLIGNFGIAKISNLNDILKHKNAERCEVVIRSQRYNYVFSDADDLIDKINKNSGVIVSRNDMVRKSIALVINYIKNNDYPTEKYSSKNGIFYDYEDNKFTYTVDNEFINIKEDEKAVKKSLLKLKEFFEITSVKDKAKVSEIFRWILFSPLSYSYKELRKTNDFFPYLVLQGEKKAGKSSLMVMFRGLYRDNHELEASSHGRSKHQFASLLGLKGWFTGIEESKGLLDEVEKIEDLKNYVSTNIIRRKQTKDSDYSDIIGYSQPIFSLNENFIITSESLLRRVIQIPFTTKDIPTKEEIEVFKNFHTENWLLPIGDAFFIFCNKNIELLKNGCENFVSTFIDYLEGKYEIELPELKWEFEEKEGILSNPDELLKDHIISIIKKRFGFINNQDLNAKPGETVTDDKGLLCKPDSSTIDRFRNAVIAGRFDYLIQNKNGENIGITKDIIPLIKKENPNFDNLSIKKIADIFGGKDRLQVKGKSIRACVLTIEEMEEYLMF